MKGVSYMDMLEFYKFHGITRSRFAHMIGVNPATLKHFEIGHDIGFESKLRIEIGIEILEDLKIIYHDRTNSEWSYSDIRNERKKSDMLFNNTFNRIILIEL